MGYSIRTLLNILSGLCFSGFALIAIADPVSLSTSEAIIDNDISAARLRGIKNILLDFSLRHNVKIRGISAVQDGEISDLSLLETGINIQKLRITRENISDDQIELFVDIEEIAEHVTSCSSLPLLSPLRFQWKGISGGKLEPGELEMISLETGKLIQKLMTSEPARNYEQYAAYFFEIGLEFTESGLFQQAWRLNMVVRNSTGQSLLITSAQLPRSRLSELVQHDLGYATLQRREIPTSVLQFLEENAKTVLEKMKCLPVIFAVRPSEHSEFTLESSSGTTNPSFVNGIFFHTRDWPLDQHNKIDLQRVNLIIKTEDIEKGKFRLSPPTKKAEPAGSAFQEYLIFIH